MLARTNQACSKGEHILQGSLGYATASQEFEAHRCPLQVAFDGVPLPRPPGGGPPVQHVQRALESQRDCSNRMSSVHKFRRSAGTRAGVELAACSSTRQQAPSLLASLAMATTTARGRSVSRTNAAGPPFRLRTSDIATTVAPVRSVSGPRRVRVSTPRRPSAVARPWKGKMETSTEPSLPTTRASVPKASASLLETLSGSQPCDDSATERGAPAE